MLLTIGIPVYNGEKYINDTINSILKCNFLWNEVEIIICDNASTDRTLKFLDKYNNIKVIEHDENIGFDGNLNRIFHYAKGMYVWAVGADDLVVPDHINDLLSAIRENQDLGVIFVGGCKEGNNTYYAFDSAESFLIQSNFRSGFFPNNIIKKQLWLSCDINNFVGSGWIHFAVILQVLTKAQSAITKNQFVIENPRANEVKTWNSNGSGLKVGLKLVEIFMIMSKWGYTREFVTKTKCVIKDSYPRQIIVSKLQGLTISVKLLRRFITLFKEFPSFWLIDFWFLVLPSRIYKIVAYFLKSLRHGA